MLVKPQGKKGQPARKILLPLRAYPEQANLYYQNAKRKGHMGLTRIAALSPLCAVRGVTGSLQLSRAGGVQRREGACSVQKVLLIW